MLFILYCTIFIFITGCQSDYAENGNAQNVQDVIIHDILSYNASIKEVPSEVKGRYGKGIGFARPEDKDSAPIGRPQTEEFHLQKGQDFSLYLILSNAMNDSRTFLTSMILDFQQVEFKLDGKSGLLHQIVVPANTEINIPLDLKVDRPGFHELFAVIFDDPNNLTLDNAFRLDLAGWIVARRTQIIVEENQTPSGLVQPIITGTPIPSETTFKGRVYFATENTDESIDVSQRQLYVGKANAGKAYDFQMVCNNTEDQPVTFALVPFLNFHQVEVSGKKQFFVYLNPNEEAVIHQEVLMPENPTVNQFQMVYLFDPYKSVLHGDVYAPFIFGSPRIAIDTR
jgi:hypothetical protein